MSLIFASWMLGMASSSIAVILGCAVSDVKASAELAPAVFVPQLLFAGLFVRINQIPSYLRWIQVCGVCVCLFVCVCVCVFVFTA